MRNYVLGWVVAGWVAACGLALGQPGGQGRTAEESKIGGKSALSNRMPGQKEEQPIGVSGDQKGGQVPGGTVKSGQQNQQPATGMNRWQRVEAAEARAGQFARAFRLNNGTELANVDSVLRYAKQAVLALELDPTQPDKTASRLLDSLRRGTEHDGLVYYALGDLYETKPAGSDWVNALKWYKYAVQVGYDPAYFRLYKRYRQLFSPENIEWLTANFNRQQAGGFPIRCRLANGTENEYAIYLHDFPQNPADPIEQESRRLLDVFGATPIEADRNRFATIYKQAVRQKMSFNALAGTQIVRRSAPVPTAAAATAPATVATLSQTESDRLVALGDGLYNNQQYAQAAQQYTTAVKVAIDDNERAWCYLKLGNANLVNGATDQAIAAYEACTSLQPRSGAYLGLSVAYRQQKKYAEALSAARRAVELKPGDAVSLRSLATAYFFTKQYPDAIATSELALQVEPGHADALARIGLSLRSLNRFDESLDYFDKAIQASPKQADLYQYHKGFVYQQMGQLPKAIELFRMAVTSDPADLDYQQALAYAYGKNKEIPQAVEQYRRLFVMAPSRADYPNELGDLYYNNEQYTESLDPYRKAVALDSANGSYQQDLGDSYFFLKQYDLAAVAFRKALALDPTLAQSNALDRLGLSLASLNRYDESLAVFDQAIRAQPQQTPVYQYYQGRIYLQTNKPDKAIELLRQSVAADPKDVDYRRMLALAYASARQWSPAIGEYKKLIELAPNRADYQNELGDVYYSSRQYGPAIAGYQKAVSLDSTDATYQKDLADAYYATKQYEQAVSTFKKTLALASGNSANALNALNTMGICLTYLKRYDEGLACFRKGIDQYGADGAATFSYNMACNYALQGKTAEAVAALDLALGKFKYKGTYDSIRTDSDFVGIRDTADFRTLLARYFSK